MKRKISLFLGMLLLFVILPLQSFATGEVSETSNIFTASASAASTQISGSIIDAIVRDFNDENRNYRKNLWTSEKAKSVMEPLLSYVDVLIANEEDVEKVLGIKASGTDVESAKLNHEGYIEVAKLLTEKYDLKAVATTLRESISASHNNWSALLYTGGEAYLSRKYSIQIVNRVGGGDSFSAGLIFAMQRGDDPQTCVEFAAAASCLKHTIEYDYNLSTVAEVEALMKGSGNGRVQR